jgi:cell division protein FtsI/penicillin-binding protein 2
METRLIILGHFLVLLLASLAGRIYYLQILKHDEVSRLVSIEAIRPNRSSAYQANQLEILQKTMDDLSLAQIRETIETTRQYLTNLQIERDENTRLVVKLREEILENNNSLETLKTEAGRLEALKHADIDTLTYLLTRDAKSENTKSFLIGLVISFPIGVAASLIASYMFRRFDPGRGKKDNVVESRNKGRRGEGASL